MNPPTQRPAWRGAVVFLLLGIAPASPVPPAAVLPRTGIVVAPGHGDPDALVELARASRALVYAQRPDDASLDAARAVCRRAGLLNRRVFLERGPTDRLHLGDNLADLLLAPDPAHAPSDAEILRVLHPGARATVGKRTLVKPPATGTDDWTHPYHGPDNNPVSRDIRARAPYRTQFLADPRYAPLPQVAVASGGRAFKLFGHIAFKAREEPWLDTLAAFNGYNGAPLWRRPIPPALMVHRNCIVATPDRIYFADDVSCKILDADTGALLDEIAPPADLTSETFWKWIALEDGTLCALLGDQEQRDLVIRMRRAAHGWPWNPLSPGFNRPAHDWGFGRTLLAIDPATRRILWHRREPDPIDSRGLCLRDGRIYASRFGDSLWCVDARTGAELWRRTAASDPALFDAIGPYQHRQDWRTNWRTTAYLRCGPDALYFVGPPVGGLVAVSAADGRLLWRHPYGNYQVALVGDALYALGGQIDAEPARKFNPRTGAVLAEIALSRRACTRVTGCPDAIFCRAQGGSTRLDLATLRPGLISPMRPNCHDGVTIAHGLLYWWPSTCDCNLTLYGITCLAPADPAHADAPADPDRLASAPGAPDPPRPLDLTAADWPMLRADPLGTAATSATVPDTVAVRWHRRAPGGAAPGAMPTAPVAAGPFVWFGDTDGAVTALDLGTGTTAWTCQTGGEIHQPPAIWEHRACVGSADGFVYALEACTGRALWRFRAAPRPRTIPVYGRLQAAWPVASGVLVSGGTAYCAAGIVNHDGTRVIALDARTGALRWENATSGALDPVTGAGVSVQGQMLLRAGRLYLAGGNAVSPAIYDAADGRCLNDLETLRRVMHPNVPGSFSPRGRHLYAIADTVRAAGPPLYAHPDYPVVDREVSQWTFVTRSGRRALAWIDGERLFAYGRDTPDLEAELLAAWGRPRPPRPAPVWSVDCPASVALAAGANAVVVADATRVFAFALGDGARLWSHPLPAPALSWGLCLTRDGTIVVSLRDGSILALGTRG